MEAVISPRLATRVTWANSACVRRSASSVRFRSVMSSESAIKNPPVTGCRITADSVNMAAEAASTGKPIHILEVDGAGGFVGLQVANHMKGGRSLAAEHLSNNGKLHHGFLNSVLPDVLNTRPNGADDALRGLCLRYPNQGDVLGLTPRAKRRATDLVI